MKVRNASAPKANEESSVAPRLLQIHLSDGHRTCIAVEQSSFGKELRQDVRVIYLCWTSSLEAVCYDLFVWVVIRIKLKYRSVLCYLMLF